MKDNDIQKIIRPEKFDKFMGQFGLMSNVVFAATNYVIARHAGAAQAEELFCELADAVAQLPVSETVGRGKRQVRTVSMSKNTLPLDKNDTTCHPERVRRLLKVLRRALRGLLHLIEKELDSLKKE